ncbi:hypothetical protein [Candidatus Liberibacter solanacearum]|nr:hypothetical protein [Candidatus Liberibacter solanacearum]
MHYRKLGVCIFFLSMGYFIFSDCKILSSKTKSDIPVIKNFLDSHIPQCAHNLVISVCSAPFSGIEKFYRLFHDNPLKISDPLQYDPDQKKLGFWGSTAHSIVEGAVIYGIGNIIGSSFSANPFVASLVGLLTISATYGHQTSENMKHLGIDESTSQTLGLLSGGFYMLSFAIPYIHRGDVSLKKIINGAGQQIATRTTEQLTTNGTLYFQGYEKEEPTEGWSNYTVIVDVILTVGLGLISRYHGMKKLKKKSTTSQITIPIKQNHLFNTKISTKFYS